MQWAIIVCNPFTQGIAMPPTRKRAMMLFCHGSPDPEWSKPFFQLQDIIAAKSPEIPVALAYLDPAKPSFADVVAQLAQSGVNEITVAPVFLARGGHVKKDLPELVAAATAAHGVRFQVLPTIGEVEPLLNGIADWIIDTSRTS
jgi:sirohydrochlorin cobaltochelatase